MDSIAVELAQAAAVALRSCLGDELAGVVLFGSYARGEQRLDSDLDVLAVLEATSMRPMQRCDAAAPALGAMRRTEAWRQARAQGLWPELGPLVLTLAEIRRFPPVMLDIATEGVVVRDRGPVATALEELRSRLDLAGARRVQLDDGGWHWDLKPGLKLGEAFEL
jgi:hypothetical protein